MGDVGVAVDRVGPVVIDTIDALTITTYERNRVFGPWARWQVEKQTRQTHGGYYMNGLCETIGAHREACRLARGYFKDTKYLLWLDDDDYLHPNRVSHQAKLLDEHPDAPYTAFTAAYFLDMKTRRLCPYESGGAAPLALTMFRRHVVGAVKFDESLEYGEDTRYMQRVEEKFGPGLRIRDPYTTVFGCHPYNVSKEARANMVFSIPLDEVREALGWTAEDDKALDALVARF